jgi:chaperone LolA
MESGKFWHLRLLRINQPSTDIILLKFLIALLFFAQASFALDDIEALNFNSMRATFIQTTHDNQDIIRSESKGYLLVKRPELMLWHINEPSERILIFDRGSILIFDPDLNQVIKTDINQYQESNWIKILLGQSELNNFYEQYIEDYSSHTLIRYEPLSNNSLMNTILLTMKEDLIHSIEIKQPERETIHIDFDEIDIDIEIKDSLFYEGIPNDAEVIE